MFIKVLIKIIYRGLEKIIQNKTFFLEFDRL